MNRDEAKLILQSYRPGGRDRHDPHFADALALAEQDPELKQWFDRQQEFDLALASHIQAVPVPADLKRKLLAPRPAWQAWLYWQMRPAWALAFCGLFLFAGTVGWFAWTNRPVSFGVFCEEIASRSWDPSPHLEYANGNVPEVRAWLTAQGIQTDFHIPSALQEARLRGVSIIEWRGQRVPVICLSDQNVHRHLIVAERMYVADSPAENKPVMKDIGPIRTVAWNTGSKTYVLTGFKTKTFVERFRQDRHWNFSS